MDLRLGGASLLGELLAEFAEERDVDAHTDLLHRHQHRHERELEALVEIDELACHQCRLERVGELQHCGGVATGLLGHLVATEVETTLFGVG